MEVRTRRPLAAKALAALAAIAAAALLALTLSAQPALAKSFPDVEQDQWYYGAVDKASDAGYVTGYKTGTFGPTDTLTRAQAAVIICRYFGGEGSDADSSAFPDVKAGSYYTASVNWAVENGVINGKTAKDGSRYFDPNGPLTRAELCVIVGNAAKSLAGKSVSSDGERLSSMPDASSVPNWGKASVEWGLDQGVISGKQRSGSRYVAPNDAVSRAEMAAIIVNCADEGVLEPDEPSGIPSDVSVGDTVTFGSYEQDNDLTNGSEAIEWRVLDVQDGKALLLSEYALDAKPYNETLTNVTWETCTLRKWLNSTFYGAAFSASDKARIAATTVSNPDNPASGISGGNTTKDKAFCLSIAEAKSYFSSYTDRSCAPTAYAVAQGAYQSSSCTVDGAGTCLWWLRSPGRYANFAADVDSHGYVDSGGRYVSSSSNAVRPALWVNL